MVYPPFTSARTLLAHGIYLAVVAIVLFFVPGLARILLPMPVAFDWWTRLLAIPLFNFGLLCIGVARSGSLPLFKLSIAMRLGVMPVAAALVALRYAPPIILVVGVIDLVSATFTLWSLTTEQDAARKKARL